MQCKQLKSKSDLRRHSFEQAGLETVNLITAVWRLDSRLCLELHLD